MVIENVVRGDITITMAPPKISPTAKKTRFLEAAVAIAPRARTAPYCWRQPGRRADGIIGRDTELLDSMMLQPHRNCDAPTAERIESSATDPDLPLRRKGLTAASRSKNS